MGAPVTTAKPTVAGETTAGPTTTRIVNVTTFTIKSALTLEFGSLPENVTGASLAADSTFVTNVADSIATGLGVDPSKVTITNIIIITRRLSEAQKRQLQGAKLKIEYELVTTDAAEAQAVEETLDDPTKAAGFASAFSTALVEKEAASGRTVVVKEIVPEKAVVTSVTEAVIIAPTPTPTPPAASPTPAPAPAAEKEEEEESDNGAVIGGVVGGVVGLGVLGGAIYAFKKKSAQE